MYLRMKVTPEKMAQIDAMIESGRLVKDVMAETGLAYGTITKAHRRQGQYMVGPRQGVTRRPPGKPRGKKLALPLDFIPKLDELINKGFTFSVISSHLKCSVGTVYKASNRIGGYRFAPARVTQ